MSSVDDDLTRRHGDDLSIPVLTELLDGAELQFVPQANTKSDVMDVEPAHATSVHDEVVHAVTARLAAEYAVVLGEQMRLQLQPAIDAAAAQLAHQTVTSLHATLTERIEQALAELKNTPDASQTPVL